MAGVRGDFAGLARLTEAAGRLITPEFRAESAMVMGAAGMKQLMDSFRQGRDPYGQPWAPLKLRKGKPLLDTGRLRASAALRPRPAGFEIVMTADYAGTHQTGKTIRPVKARLLSWTVRGNKKRFFARQVTIPRRQMLPTRERLGPYWTRALSDAWRKKAAQLFTGVTKKGGRK